MELQKINPYLRAAEIQPSVLEGEGARVAYDHRLFYVLAGEGELIISGGEHSLHPDALIFISPGVGYHFRGKMRMIVLNFDLTRVSDGRKKPICPPPAAEFCPESVFDPETLDGFDGFSVTDDARELRDGLLLTVQTFNSRDPIADASTSGMLKAILASLLRGRRASVDPTSELVERVRRYIRIYAPEIADNGAVARHFGYHPVYLASVFRESTGETLHHAIVSERIRLAEEMLSRTDRSVEEIAADTGFSSRGHFCTVFKARTGVSPLQYRAGRG